MLKISITQNQNHIQQKKDWVTVAREAYKLKVAIKALKEKESVILKSLKTISDNCSSKGGGLLFTLIECKGAVKYKDIPELSGVDLEVYRGKNITRWLLERV